MAAEGRKRRVPGGDPILDNTNFRNYVIRILDNDPSLGCLNGRLLRLKPDLCPDATSVQLDIVIDALKENWRVEVLYIQNFEKGFGDRQLAKLTSLLKQGRIWALNVGENFSVSLAAWEEFTAALPETLVSYIYVSEHKLRGTDMKNRMRTAIRYNRKILGPRDPVLCAYVTNMWFNPPAPGRCTAGQPLTIDTASSLKEAPSISVVSARRKRDLERIKSRREALAAAGMPPPRTPVDTSVLQPTVANMKRFQFVDFLELPARVRVSPLPPAPLHPAAAACIAYMHHTVSSSAQSIPSALELQQDVSLRETQQPEEGLQILPLALPAAYVDRASASPRSGASSAFRLDCGVDAADVHDHGASAEVRSPAGARVSRMCGRAAPTVPGAAVGCQAEPTRRSKRAVKKRAWADDSDEEGGGKAVTQGRRGKKTRPPLSASGRARRAIQAPARFAAT